MQEITNKRIITLTTDFGYNSYYIGVMKGIILKINPNVEIIDICHNIKAHDIYHGAYFLKSAYKYFPADTIHLAVIDPGVGSKRKPIIVKTRDYYFILPDNGLISLVLNEGHLDSIYAINNREYFLDNVSNTFHGRDIFAPIAAHLSLGKPLDSFGNTIDECVLLKTLKPEIFGEKVVGHILHIDDFGNLITDVSSKLFEVLGYQKDFVIKIKDKIIKKIRNTYSDTEKGEILALFGSNNTLEICANQASAAKLLNIQTYETFEITFTSRR